MIKTVQRKKTGKLAQAVQWFPGENDDEVRTLIMSNVEETVAPEDAESFVYLTMAITDAHPQDWIIAELQSTHALTPRAFELAYEDV